MLSIKDQTNNIWSIYNQQEKHNKYWFLLFGYLLLHSKNAFNKSDYCGKNQKLTKKSEKNLYKSFKEIMKEDSDRIKIYLEEHLKDTYIKTWKVTCKNLETDLELPDIKEIYQDINKTWVGKKNFKERQEHNSNLIISKLEKVLKDEKLSLIQKEKLADKLINQYKNTVKRLVRTETIHTIGQASIRCMNKNNIAEVIWITCMDEKECIICGSRDRRIYPIDMIPQYPDHPNCRCLLIAYRRI